MAGGTEIAGWATADGASVPASDCGGGSPAKGVGQVGSGARVQSNAGNAGSVDGRSSTLGSAGDANGTVGMPALVVS